MDELVRGEADGEANGEGGQGGPKTPWVDGEKHFLSFGDLRLALQNALAKFDHANTHERRAAHEAKARFP